MAARTDLRKFQESLIERLNASTGQPTLNAKLGFQIGEEGWLVELTGVSEVLPVPQLDPVPMARKWLIGIANIRGHLFTVVDMQAFFGQPRMDVTTASRILLLSPRIARGVALQVSSIHGLRHDGQFSVDESYKTDASPGESPWIKAAFRDASARIWRELDPQQLVTHPAFVDVSE